MTIHLNEANVRRLARRAEARGLAPERYGEEVLQRDLETPEPRHPDPVIAERLERIHASFAKSDELWRSDEQPPIPEGAFSSEALYECGV